jgi:hypothetical protein
LAISEASSGHSCHNRHHQKDMFLIIDVDFIYIKIGKWCFTTPYQTAIAKQGSSQGILACAACRHAWKKKKKKKCFLIVFFMFYACISLQNMQK